MNKNKLNEYIVAGTAFALTVVFVIAMGRAAIGDPGPASYYQFNGAATVPITSSTFVSLGRMGPISTYTATLANGAAAYTGTLALSESGIHPGDIARVTAAWPGTTYAHLVIMDGSAGGSVLVSESDTAVSGAADYWFVNTTGAQWAFTPKGDQSMRKMAAGVPAALSSSNAAMGLSGTSTAMSAPEGSTVIFEGDSNTQSPNGYGVTSWAALLASGTFPLDDWFSTARCIITAQGGSVVYGGTSTSVQGTPQTIVAKWTGSNATSLTILSGSAYGLGTNNGSPIPMGVFGSQIQFGTTGTITSSGTALALSAPTTGTSGTGVTLRLGGNNAMDRFPSQAAIHAPAAHGGDGGLGPVYYFLQGFTNDLRGNETAAQIEAALVALTGTARAYGMIPIIGTTIPCGQVDNGAGSGPVWWTGAEEPVREVVNSYIRGGSLGCYWVDSTQGFSGDSVTTGTYGFNLLDLNSVHMSEPANVQFASYINSAFISGLSNAKAQPQFQDQQIEFQQGLILDGPLSFGTNDYSTSRWIGQMSGQSVGQILHLLFGRDNYGGSYDAGDLRFYLSGTSGASGNAIGMAPVNYPEGLWAYGDGGVSIGMTPSAYSTSAALLTIQGSNAATDIVLNPGNAGSASIVANTTNASSAGTPIYIEDTNLSTGDFVGVGINDGNGGSYNNTVYMGMEFVTPGYGGNAVVMANESSYGINNAASFRSFADGDSAIDTASDNGYALEVNGTEKVDGNATLSGTNMVNGLQVSSTGTVLRNLVVLTGTAGLPQMNPGTSGTMTIANSALATGGEVWWLASAQLPTNTVLASGTVSASGTAQIVFNNPSVSATVSSTTVPYQMLYLH